MMLRYERFKFKDGKPERITTEYQFWYKFLVWFLFCYMNYDDEYKRDDDDERRRRILRRRRWNDDVNGDDDKLRWWEVEVESLSAHRILLFLLNIFQVIKMNKGISLLLSVYYPPRLSFSNVSRLIWDVNLNPINIIIIIFFIVSLIS